MKSCLFVIFVLFFSIFSFCQKPYEFDPAKDIYEMQIIFKSKLFSAQCDCCCAVSPKKEMCSLYEVEVKQVISQIDTTVFKNKQELKQVKYLVLADNIQSDDIKLNTTYSIFSYNSCSDKFLVVGKVLEEFPNPMPSYEGFAYFIGLGICKQKTFFQKLQLRLGIRKNKIYRKLKEKPSKFLDTILHLEKDSAGTTSKKER
jgi:hypothetical protein